MRQEDEYDLGLTTITDVATDPLYVFTSKTLDPNALAADKKWVCYRITVATGSKSFAKHPDTTLRVTNFTRPEKLLQASLAATYTY